MSTKRKGKHGGRRAGAGRPSTGKGRYLVSLTASTVAEVKAKTDNFSGLLDSLLEEWNRKVV